MNQYPLLPKLMLLASLLAAVPLPGGCGPEKARLDPPEAEDDSPDISVPLLGPESDVTWATLMGPVDIQAEKIVLQGRDSKAISIARNIDQADGQFFFVVREDPEAASAGPYTISLRSTGGLLDWRALYVVIRPEQIELVRGSVDEQTPGGRSRKKIPPVGPKGVRNWRISLSGPEVQVWLEGEKVIEHTDSRPESGSIALTADGTNIALLSARYRPLESEQTAGSQSNR
ncbi:MAG: hypothetical protein ACLFUJ_14195 [Phycisphaerae bacterium]